MRSCAYTPYRQTQTFSILFFRLLCYTRIFSGFTVAYIFSSLGVISISRDNIYFTFSFTLPGAVQKQTVFLVARLE
ncbi:uncharacterized protein BO66DRAFT_104439 [Aspergillus aculeatinus CBS 121060]|uniref:Uncharacterized protein n=1 Tax=Aspergillus aculeatinus CBS 121060 TaxID=1448322 RepID=A0ACD1H7D3_9EURO|nr:hypothetical protein BO66DRAFT_104439 [Aspergillus aculeatinus CBS 121060]RAH69321.1 hypothetical protein BO66DRAFT_104439 [Aspergillus aculeatinus CBS 121060]